MKIKIFLLIIFISFLGIYFSFDRNNSQDKRTELVFWSLQLGTFDNYINSVISEFEKENPDIKIKWVDVPYSEGEKRTLAALLSDNPPDLINLTPDFSIMAAQKNTLYEIPEDVMDNFPESLYDALSYNGKFFAIPFYLSSAITFANADLIKKANIASVPKTYDEMFGLARHIKNKTGACVEMPAINENDTFWKILNKYGIDVFKDLENKKSLEIFKMYNSAYKNNFIPKESLTQGHREALEKYMSGQVVFLQAGSNFLNIIKENAPDIYKNTILAPQMTGSTGKYDFSLMNLIIPSKSKHKQEALKFALFLTNEQNQLEFVKLTSVLPANKNVLKNPYFNMSSSKEDEARKISAFQIKNLNNGIKNSRNKKNVITLVNTAIARILADKNNLYNDKAIEDILKEYDKKIKEYEE